MNKKIIYGIFFVSLFLISTVSSVHPVQGYEFSVPDEAVGVTVEFEIKVYDEDEFEDHLGKGNDIDNVFEYIGGDSDVVGAKGKSKVTDIEKRYDSDGIQYIERHAWDSGTPYTVREGNTMTLDASSSLWDLPLRLPGGWAIAGWNLTNSLARLYTTFGEDMTITNAAAAKANLTMFNMMENQITAAADALGYGKRFDGTYVTVDYWEPTEDSYKAKPDEKDMKIPYLADPRDWYEHWVLLNTFKNQQQADITTLRGLWANEYASYFNSSYGQTANYTSAYEALNTSIYLWYLGAAFGPVDPGILALYPPNDLTWFGGNNYTHHDFVVGLYGAVDYVLEFLWWVIESGNPDKFGTLLKLLLAGQPIYTPSSDYMAKVLDLFDIDDDVLYKIPYLHYGRDLNGDGLIVNIEYGKTTVLTGLDLLGETVHVYAYVDISEENGVVTVEIEYPDGQIDPSDRPQFNGLNTRELDDFEYEFAFGDYGAQETRTIKDGDTIIWQLGLIEQIPGFEISIILGASAISIIGLIYVVMKKRRR